MYQIDTASGHVNYSWAPDIHIFYPTLAAAIAEGLYLLSAERNPNFVKMSAYAPSFANLNYEEWTPNLVALRADYDMTILSTSHYMQQLFVHHRGGRDVTNRSSDGKFQSAFVGCNSGGRRGHGLLQSDQFREQLCAVDARF
ncbi:uncharacterized protein A1O5_00826 [Cladophialophora psammophila CBS 110553]|uniref:Alpha-L-arabinofuranosidase C-terminal domain-containing protein n=1 Tax=Cladophialophora psammophila CBS 110553 TaxID=1182543 RepID=W9X7W8_9EURO|nr:uncharacterized protein A1O5_00826 [Cladophialophora psammophila CBS 110553]EXJ76318.1 hypothetical protein A1O5_00826 [Cladophialophora psammophila CBS 110553]